jgi:cellulose biosynthesis protein BcsQ
MRAYREHFAESFLEMPVFEAFIRQQGSIKDDPDLGHPTVAVEPLSHAAIDYRAFAGELAKRLGELARAEASA